MTPNDVCVLGPGVGVAAFSIMNAMLKQPRRRYMLALLKGALSGFIVVGCIFAGITVQGRSPGGFSVAQFRQALALGAATGAFWGIPLGMAASVELLGLRLRREARRVGNQTEDRE